MNKRVFKYSESIAASICKRAVSLLIGLAMLPALPSIVFAEGEQAQTQYLVNENYEQEITDPSEHATPSISEWKAGQTTAQITYQDGRVFFEKLNSDGYSADFVLPLSKGYALGEEPLAEAVPCTDLYVEFDWKAFDANVRLYLKGIDPETGKKEQIFYLSQNNNRLVYTSVAKKTADNISVSGTTAFNQAKGHTIRLLLKPNAEGSYTLSKSWVDNVLDREVNLAGIKACSNLYMLAIDERRSSGTGLGSSFGSLKVWQSAEVQLQNILDTNPVDLTFEDIKGQNTDADAVTENLVLPVGTVLSNGLKVVGWQSSDTQIITNAGGVVRPGGTEDIAVELTPILAIYDGIGDGSEGFEPTDVTAEGAPITVTVKANPEEPTPPEPTETPEPPGETAVTQFLVNEDYEQEITDPTKHSVPFISEWSKLENPPATAKATYQGGRVYLEKLNNGKQDADLFLPLSKGTLDGSEPEAEGTPATDVYVEVDWKAHNSGTTLYMRGLKPTGGWTNLFYFTQSGTKLRYISFGDNAGVTGTLDMKITDAHTIRLLMRRTGDTYTIAKAWIDGQFDKDINLKASIACNGLYYLLTDEKRNSGTGLGSSFGSLRVWQTAEAQLQSMIDSGKADITFDDIKGANTNAESVTGNLVLQSGNTLASGLTVVGWETATLM